jgi:hypothetical protein
MMKSTLAPMPLADEALTAVAGAKRGRKRGGGLSFDASPVTNTQINVAAPVIQIALFNGGGVEQFADVLQGNAIKF